MRVHLNFIAVRLSLALGLLAGPLAMAEELGGRAGEDLTPAQSAAAPVARPGEEKARETAKAQGEDIPGMPKVVMARVGDVEITVEEFLRFLAANSSKVREASTAEGKAGLLRTAIENRLLLAALVQEGLIDQEFKQDASPGAMVQLAERHFPLPPVPSEDKLKEFYEAHAEDFGIPSAVRLSQILIGLKKDAGPAEREAARARAEQAMERLKAGEDFGQVALEVTDRADIRDRKGDIGFVSPRGHQWLTQAIAGLDVGQYSGVLESPTGFDILMLTDRREAVLTPFEQAREAVAKRMRDEAQAQARAAYVKKLAASIPISIEMEELKPYFANGVFP
jgi:parvulin-like peptidyl-prolyl isomerase